MDRRLILSLGFSIITYNVSAQVCQMELKDHLNRRVQIIRASGINMDQACFEARKECMKTLRLSQRNGTMIDGSCHEVVRPLPGGSGPGPVVIGPAPGSGGHYPGGVNPRPPQYHHHMLQTLEIELRSSQWRVRQQAALELGYIPLPEALILALKTVSDTDVDVRNAAQSSIQSLTRLLDFRYDGEIIAQSSRSLMLSSSWRVRHETIKVLGLTESVVAVELALHSHQDTDIDVRNAAAQSLRQLISSQMVIIQLARNINPVQSFTMSSNWRVRLATVSVLQEIRTHEARMILMRLSNDSDIDVRNAARNALR